MEIVGCKLFNVPQFVEDRDLNQLKLLMELISNFIENSVVFTKKLPEENNGEPVHMTAKLMFIAYSISIC
jgi:predicted house-cleaning noncanonical NTP pyrophosphatase (MazG superfamily)